MIRRLLTSSFHRLHVPLVFESRLYNFSASVYQQSQDLFDISDELLVLTDPSPNSSKISSEIATRRSLTKRFKHFFDISDGEAIKFVDQNKKLHRASITKITAMIELLFTHGIKAKTIMENPNLLLMKPNYIQDKIPLLDKLQPRDINDVIPFIRLSAYQILRVNKLMKNEEGLVAEGNRIYYFAKQLNVEPSLVSKYFATHLFMFELSFHMLVQNLNVLLEFEVAPMNILRDLWCFKYFPSSVRARLERCKNADRENLKPWMVRCPEEILQRSLELSQEKKNLLGEKTTIEYLSERLGYDIPTIENLVSRQKQVMKVRVTRIKDVLDYLLIEEKFKPYEVANALKIVCHKLETTKSRIEELKHHGCRPSTLVTLCKSQTEYNKFLNNWIELKKKKQE